MIVALLFDSSKESVECSLYRTSSELWIGGKLKEKLRDLDFLRVLGS